jgi:hypothetical protein
MPAGPLSLHHIKGMYGVNFNPRLFQYGRDPVAAGPVKPQGDTAVGGELSGCRDKLDFNPLPDQKLFRSQDR